MTNKPSSPLSLVTVRGTELLPDDTRERYRQKLARITLDSMVQFVGLLDAEGTVLEINHVALDAVGIRLSDVEGKPFWTTFWWQVSEEINALLKESIRRASQGEFVRWDTEIFGRAGGKETIIIDASLMPVKDDQGRVVFITAEGRDITEKKAHEREIARQREELARLDVLKTQFFANISHEFRTPLTLMLGPLEDVLGGANGVLSADAAANLAASHRNALRLLKLVNTMLDFSRIEAGRVQASYQPTDLAALTAELASNFRSLCEKAGLRLTVDCGPPVPSSTGQPAYVDRDMWEKIVLNLLSNAFKFTLRGEIEVRLEEAEGRARLTVRDTGVGIPSEELPHMFERFHRIQRSRGRTQEGTGIGLALVQELVKLHGGTISVASEAGKGTEFVVTIPLGTAHLDPHRIGTASSLASTAVTHAAFVEEALHWLPDEPAPAEEVSASAAQTETEKPRILWADDNADMRAYVSRLLASRFDVQAVADGEAALQAARAHPPDLILSDVMMPKLDGFGLLAAVRNDPSLLEIPIILLSARAGEESRVEGLEAGADDYLVKPFSARELVARVDTHVKMSRVRQEAQAASQASALLSAIVDSSDDAIISKDLNGVITSWNKGAERLFGYSAEEAVGKSITIIIPVDRLDEEPQILERLKRGERVEHFETIRVRKDGAPLNISLTISPVKDTRGRIVGASKVARDVTEKVRQEAALLEANEALTQANSDLQQFAYSASHDLQEPLRMVAIYSELLRKKFGDKLGSAGEEYIGYTVQGAARMELLLRDLLAYTQLSATDKESAADVNAGETLQKTLANLQTAINESGAEISSTALPTVRMHEFQLEQVFQNLIANAIRYRSAEKPPRIRIAAVREGATWLFSVEDNGIGIEPQFKEQIFGIFKRLHTAAEYPGTGIGLAICQRIIERAGGRIWVESAPGRGSTFFFTIPRRGP